jgi:peptidoglycan/xylan/chitin deacetylase (PgdA/CDA1 family)
MNKAIMLNYHAVTHAFREGVDDPVYAVTAAVFKQQVECMQGLGWEIITLAEWEGGKGRCKPAAMLTFDDGHSSDYEIVLPILQHHGVKAAFFVPTSKLQDGCLEHYRTMAQAGHLVGPHGVTHRYLADLSTAEQGRELQDSKLYMEERFGAPADYFALPGGKYNRTTVQAAKDAGYKALLTTEFGFVDAQNPGFLLPRWTIRRTTSLKQFSAILKGHRFPIQSAYAQAVAKKVLHRVVSSKWMDKINYTNRR